MVEHDDDQGTDSQDSGLVRDLRKQLKAQSQELGELRQFRTERVLQKAGFDPDSKIGKALVKLHEGDLTPEGLRATAEEYGYDVPAVDSDTPANGQVPPETQERVDTISRINDLRTEAAPVGSGPKMPYDEYQQLRMANPSEAATVLQQGKVDLPAHIASSLAANRADRATQIGA